MSPLWMPTPPKADGYFWCRRRFHGRHIGEPEIVLIWTVTIDTKQGPITRRRYRIATTGYSGPLADDWMWWPPAIQPPKD